MQIPCSHCGLRGHDEFTYLGDATSRRPAWARAGDLPSLDDAARQAWHDYVHLRENPSGPHRELWHHSGGCHAWLVVTRDTRTHEVLGVEPASTVASKTGGAP